MKREIIPAMALVLAAAVRIEVLPAAEIAPEEPHTAAGLVRAVYAAEDWIRRVDSCLIRTRGVHYKPAGREPSPPPSAAEFERFRGERDWPETQRWSAEIAWDRKRVRSIQDYPASGLRMASTWDGRVLTVHEKSPSRDRESYGLYDDSREHLLLTRRVNLWEYGGLVINDRGAWWGSRDPDSFRLRNFLRPEDFQMAGRSTVDGRECQVVESRAGGMQLAIDAADRRVRRIIQFSLPNDLEDAVWLAAMEKAGAVDLAAPREWKPWLETLDPERRLAAERRLSEELFPSKRIRSEIYPADYVEVVPGGWMPRRYTRISSYPDWDAVERTGKYTYVVDRGEVEVAELKVDEPLPAEALSIDIPEGGKVYDWRFDPPAEYDFRKDRTEDEIRAIAEEARRKRDERTAPYREMLARIEERVGREAPELPSANWFNGGPLELSGLRGKIVILHFWATWCAPCHNDIRALVALRKSAASDPLVIGIHDAKADAGSVDKAIAELNIKYPVCIDSKSDPDDAAGDVSQRSWYRIAGIPHAILIDRQGRIAAHGSLDAMLEKAAAMK